MLFACLYTGGGKKKGLSREEEPDEYVDELDE